jgi:hypothetical protein
MNISILGWVATAVFGTSYLFKEAATLRRIQAAAACLWIIYGIAIGAVPVVVANLVVAGAAIYSSFRRPSTAPGCGQGRLAGLAEQSEIVCVVEEM